MTKPRPLNSVYEAIDRVAGLIGYANAAHHIGKSESYIRQCGDPDGAREIFMHEAMRLDQVCRAEHGETPFADYLRRKDSEVTWDGKRVDVRDVGFELQIQLGKMVEAIRAAKAPTGPGGTRMTAGERAQISRLLSCMERTLSNTRMELACDTEAAKVVNL